MDLQEGDVDVRHRVVVTLGRIANEKFTLRIVVFQPILQGSTYEAASNNSNVDHVDEFFNINITLDLYNVNITLDLYCL